MLRESEMTSTRYEKTAYEEAKEAYEEAARNLSYDDIKLVQSEVDVTEDESLLLHHAQQCYRRKKKLKREATE